MQETYWEVSFGFYPGILLGFRTYQEMDDVKWEEDPAILIERNHVLYIPFVDMCVRVLTLKKD
jgi:hypothetical protein